MIVVIFLVILSRDDGNVVTTSVNTDGDEHTYDDIPDDTSKATYLKRQVHAVGFVHQEHAE